MLWHVREGDDDVLVDEDEQGEEEAQARGTERVQPCQLVEWRKVEEGSAHGEHRD